ncbi:K02A2.6-like, partial [Cordylochernes scorpioides]
MASYQFKEYNEETETFETFYERLEQFLILEEAGDEKKKAYLLTFMGSKTYSVLKNLCSPILPKDKTFDNLIDILKRHFSPKRSIVVERFIFFKRMQLKEESISDYLVEIKRLASSCNFGNFLEDSLRDKMVCGLYNAKIQNRILSEGDISLAKVIEIALSMEAAEKNTKSFHLEQGEDCVDKLRMERKVESNFQNGKCKHCGKQHKELCRFKEAICFKCNKKGHIASICWSSRRNLRQHQNQPGNIHQIGDQEEEEEYVQKIISVTIPEYKINFASSDPPYLTELKVEGNFIKFEMDTGSGLTLISEKDFKNSLQHLKLEKASIIVRTYDGTVVPILGKINVKVECQDITYKLRALVVKGEKRALMGREWINRLKLGCFAVKHMPVEITIEEILKENQALFVETTEPIKGFTFSVNMCDVNPIFHKARPVPFAIRPAVTEALDKMVAKGYLCEVASSKWATPVVVVPKKNKEIRICCEFKVTLNKYLDTAAYPLPTQQDLFSTLAKGKYFSKLDLRNAYLQLEVDPGTRPLLTINTHKGMMITCVLQINIFIETYIYTYLLLAIYHHLLSSNTKSHRRSPRSRLNNVYALSYVEELPITAEEIATETEKDEVLSLAKFYTQQGWPEKVADHLRPYFQRKLELTVDGECLVWGMRVVIPPSLRIKMLNCLHETHSGMNKMKAVARSHFWWPNLDTQIEFLVNKCRSCQQSQDGPNKGKWQPWKWSTRPWQRIHIDFANKENINLLIVVDSHSKWIEAIPMRETTTRKTIEQLRRFFSSYGLPEELVSDNGPQFTGSEMKGFLEGNGIKQTLIPAYHPQSNGLAERAVRTIKTALDKNKRKIGDTIQDTLSKVLLAYRSTPHVTTGKTPSELFIGRALRTRVSLIHPSLASRVRDQQARQMKYDRRTHLEEFQIDDLVWCKNFRGGDKWIPGKIVGKKGTRVYTILIHGQVKAYHRDQIRKRWRNGEEDESGDGEHQPEHSRGAGPSAIISEVVRDRGYMESLSPGLTSQRSDQDSEVQSDTDDGKSLEPLRSLDPEALKEEGKLNFIFKMANFGSIESFDPKNPEKWIVNLERMIFFFLANDIVKAERRKAIFLTLIGAETYAIARSLASPKELSFVEYDYLIKLLTDHFCPKPNIIVQRFLFNKRNQGDESVSAYVAELRKLSENCEFVDLEDRLRDRLVCGLRKESIVKILLSESNLTFKKALNIAICDESASAQTPVFCKKGLQ